MAIGKPRRSRSACKTAFHPAALLPPAGRVVDAARQREEAELGVPCGAERRPRLLRQGERQIPRCVCVRERVRWLSRMVGVSSPSSLLFIYLFSKTKSCLVFFAIGFARLASESHHGGSPIHWVLPAGMNAKMLGGVFKIDWLCR